MPSYFKYQLVDEADAIDENGCLKDKHSVRVSMRDAQMARAQFTDEVRITDAGDTPLGLHRPGFRVAAGRTRDDSHYRAYDAETTSAWQNNPPIGASVRAAGPPQVKENMEYGAGSPARNFGKQREGDLCMVEQPGSSNKQPGRLRRDPTSGDLVCVADQPSGSADKRSLDDKMADHRLRMAEEYEAYDRQLCQAYKTLDSRKKKQDPDEDDPEEEAISDHYQQYIDRVTSAWRTGK